MSVPCDIATMPIERVEVDEVGHQQSTLAKLPQCIYRLIEDRFVVGRFELTPRRTMTEEIADLADGNHLASHAARNVQQGRRWGFHPIIAPMGGAREGCRIATHEGSRDHPTH